MKDYYTTIEIESSLQNPVTIEKKRKKQKTKKKTKTVGSTCRKCIPPVYKNIILWSFILQNSKFSTTKNNTEKWRIIIIIIIIIMHQLWLVLLAQ